MNEKFFNCSQIFKECDKVSEKELDIIKKYSPEYKRHDDPANGYVAFALNFDDGDTADDLVWELNEVDDLWFVGDENEEYVFVD